MPISRETLNMNSLTDKNVIYQRMIEEIQDYAIILMDDKGIIQNWNKGAEKIKGYKEEDILGKHFSIFYLQEDLDTGLPYKLMNEAKVTGRAMQEGWRKRKDGTRFWGSITITALHDDAGEVIGYSKVTRDLTGKKIAEDQLRLSEERYHGMIAEVQDYAIILLDANGIIENWNAGAANIKGYTAEEAIGKHIEIFYTPEDLNVGLPDKLLNLAADTGKATHEGWRVRKDGTRFWGSITITALHGKDNNIIGFSKVTRDLTQKKLAEDKLAAYTEELEVQNSELEQFAYVASHDLQEPLRKIQTFSELIKENYDNKEFALRYFDKLDASAKRMAALVKALLNYSRLTKDKAHTTVTSVDLNNVLAEVKQDFELLVEEKNAVIKSGKLPTVTGNTIQLEQLFFNLISNSLKFSKTNPIVEISCSIVDKGAIKDAPKSLADGKYYLLEFKDNGIGFEEEYAQTIFGLFQRLHGKEEYAGTGIGLALCKKIVENHKGTIKANSTPGKGATFCVYLPVAV